MARIVFHVAVDPVAHRSSRQCASTVLPRVRWGLPCRHRCLCNPNICYCPQGPGAIAPQPDESDIEEFLSTIRDYPTPPREYFDIEAKV